MKKYLLSTMLLLVISGFAMASSTTNKRPIKRHYVHHPVKHHPHHHPLKHHPHPHPHH